jgi:hypothetical protein
MGGKRGRAKQLGILQRDIYPFTAPTTSATKQAGNLIRKKLKKKRKECIAFPIRSEEYKTSQMFSIG